MLKVYGFSKVNAVARGHTRDLRVLWALEEIPGDRAGEAQVVRWCFAAMNSVEPPLLSLRVLDWTADGSCGNREFLVRWANRVLTNLERWFADRDFVATTDFSVADILMAHVLSAGVKTRD